MEYRATITNLFEDDFPSSKTTLLDAKTDREAYRNLTSPQSGKSFHFPCSF